MSPLPAKKPREATHAPAVMDGSELESHQPTGCSPRPLSKVSVCTSASASISPSVLTWLPTARLHTHMRHERSFRLGQVASSLPVPRHAAWICHVIKHGTKPWQRPWDIEYGWLPADGCPEPKP